MSSSSSSSSPNRSRSSNSNNSNEERPRYFDGKAKSMCWAKAETVPGRHPERWRKDAAGNIVCKRFCNCHGCLCFEYDHIVPFSKGGESTADNCQILQTRVNRFKSDKEQVDATKLKGFSCDVKFTDKELDIIEMAVYGDVIRPGNQCRCKTVAEMLGQFKSKDRMAACKLPYDGESL
ncbi:F6A14.21 protein [Citrus sinensis]|uniref:F6A14.21 protein n=1 Tax=Citrus sinensis TaxID=2711 RepID=A0ACB8LX61_CITSI|nr:F6A14.21 protein [Citrus sinensis]